MAVAELTIGRHAEASKLKIALIIGCSVLIMLCAGSVYAWSIFVAPLRAEYGLSMAETQLIYGASLATLGVFLVFVHNIYRRFGPRITAAVGAVFFCSGYVVASFSQGNMWVLFLGISIIAAFGMSLAYLTVLTTLMLWLPDRKGLATGVAMAGFGGGTILMSQIASPMLNNGVPVLEVFRIMGIILGAIFFICSFFISRPPCDEQEAASHSRVDYRKLVKDKRFWILFYTAFAAAFGGLMFYGNIKPLGITFGVSAGIAGLAIVLMSAGNAIGRLTWGQIHDMIGSRKSILLSLVLVAVCITLLQTLGRSDLTFIIMVPIFGFCFGADQVLYAANTANVWGVDKLNVIYPLIFLGYGLAAIIAPTLGGSFYDMTNSYTVGMFISIAVCFSGFAVYALMMPRKVNKGSG